MLSWIEVIVLLALVLIVAYVASKGLNKPAQLDGYARIARIQRHPYGALKGIEKK